MIHISIDGKKPNSAWLKKAKELSQALCEANNIDDQKRIIEKNKNMWGGIKEWLMDLSHQKCWYTEAKELCSDYDVDHFRPKSSYPWLAFDWTNYRISGAIPNRPRKDPSGHKRGKHDHFPLLDDSKKADSHSSDIKEESPYLLDPTNLKDIILLTFNERGLPVAASQHERHRRRVEKTIELLYLDRKQLVDARKDVWLECKRKIKQVEDLLKEASQTQCDINESAITHIQEDLMKMVSSQTELSGTARACLLKSRRKWVLNLVTSVK